MKNANKSKIKTSRLAMIAVGLLLAGLTSGCAPPSSSDAGLKNELTLLKKQQQQQQQALLAIQQELTQLQQQLEVPPMETVPSGQPIVIPGGETQAEAPVLTEVEDLVEAASSYLEAFSALAMGRQELAREGFERFLKEFPEHQYAPNARYWQAETEIALGLLAQAEKNLLLVANNPADESKAPEAMLRLSQLYQQQNLTEQAEDILHQLRSRFPESRQAQH